MRDEVVEFIEFVGPKIEGVPFESAFRQFIGGWEKHGRLYASGEFNYQNMKSEHRHLITLDGEPTSEIDVKNSHLSILYALSGLPVPDGDLYAVPGVERAIAKAWITVLLGAHRFLSKWPKRPLRKLREAGINPLPYPRYKDAILRAHPCIVDMAMG